MKVFSSYDVKKLDYIDVEYLDVINIFKNIFSDKCRDPCEDVSCPDPHSECKVTDHEARCRCKEGYQEVEDSDSTVDCQLEDPCQPNPCGPFSACQAQGSNLTCACLPGYKGSPPHCKGQSTVNLLLPLGRYIKNFAHLLFVDETADFIDKIQFNFSQKFNYADAMKFCKDRNSRLIEIDTREQMKAVAAELQRVVDTGSLVPHCFKGCPDCANECYTAFWTGASDEAQEGTWVWNSSGTQISSQMHASKK